MPPFSGYLRDALFDIATPTRRFESRDAKAGGFVNRYKKEDGGWGADESGDGLIKMLNDDNFESFRMKAKGGVFVMFSQPWCKPCQEKKVEFLKAARMANVKKFVPGKMETGGIPFAAVDCQENSQLCRAVNVKGYPSFAYFTVESGLHKVCDGNKQPGFYNNEWYYSGHHPYVGQYNANHFVQFVKTRRNNQWHPEDAKDFINRPLWGSEETNFAESGEVVFVDDYHWSWYRKTTQRFLAMFYKDRARPFRKARPEYAAASTELRRLWPDVADRVPFVAVDCDRSKQVCSEFGVNKYPQFMFFNRTENLRDNVPIKWHFQEGRTRPAFVQFAKHMSRPWKNRPDWMLSNRKDLERPSGNVQWLADYDMTWFRKKYVNGFLAFFYAPWCAASRAAQYAVTKLSEDSLLVDNNVPVVAVDCTYTNSTCKMTGMEHFPAFRWIQGNDIQAFTASRSVAGLRRFVQRKIDPNAPVEPWNTGEKHDGWTSSTGMITFLADENFDDWAAENGKFVAMFYAPWCEHCRNSMSMFADASYHSTLHFAAIDADASRMLKERYEVTHFPTYLLFDDAEGKTDDPVNLDHDLAEITEAEDMTDWLRANGFFQSQRKHHDSGPRLISKDAPRQNEGMSTGAPGVIPDGAAGHVLKNVWSSGDKVLFMGDSYFDTYKRDVDQFVAFFYAPWCGHCKKAKPEFSAASVRAPIPFVAVDCTDTDAIPAQKVCRTEGVRSFPTINYYEKGEAHKYTGPRSATDFASYAETLWDEYSSKGTARAMARGW
jgi:thiol-disulfide isomerase/thioredoxin